ncbi:MAG: acetylornithine/succinylornithine family transaminase [Longimicrobiales bacterium]
MLSPFLGVYGPPPVTLVSGQGCRVTDDRGRTYLDFTAGIAVTALGHGAPEVENAVRSALDSGLIHTSNLYRTLPAERLARALIEHSFPGGVFFCNSGGEANEAALKFARRYAGTVHGPGRSGFLAFRGSFHGRLFGTVAATDRPAYREPFLPVMPGVRFADFDLDAVGAVLDEGETAAVILEPVQGEGGVRPVDPAFLQGLRARCDATGTLLILDEVQCGLGRTGRLFAHQHAGVTPDILTLAKPLAGGLPMGAVIATPAVDATLKAGDHGTTFGGGPLVSTVALAVLERVADPAFLAEVARKGQRLADGLDRLVDGHAAVRGRRGLGLMQGLALSEGSLAAPVVQRAREAGLLVVSAGPDVVRLLPPLVVDDADIDEAVGILDTVLSSGGDPS